MDISDIAAEEYVEVEADTRLAKVRSLFERENPKGVVVTNGGEYAGVVGEKELVRSQVDDDTKATAVTTQAPELDRHEDVRDAARKLVEGNVKIAPVYEGKKPWGIVTADGILRAVVDSLDAIDVDDIYTENVVTVDEKDHVGQAINRLREHDISRLPVLGEDGDLTGIVTTNDIIDFVVRDGERQGSGDRSGDTDSLLDLPVYDLMTSPVTTAQPGETVEAAVERMFDQDISGLVVSPTASAAAVTGILTKTDVLRALSFTEDETMDVQITNVSLLDTLSRAEIVENITEVADKYREMQVHHAHVRFHEHKEKLRGTPLIQCQIRLRTSHGQAAGSGEGYGADHAFNVALEKLQRNVLEIKDINADEEYRGQLLRKLNEL
ncbi:MAG: CBS domain-containing protein [Halolamina sp.]